MIMIKKIVITILLTSALAACTKDSLPGDSHRIKLRAGISELEVTSKASAVPFKGNTPSSKDMLNAELWFSYTSEQFKNSPVAPEYLPCHTNMTFKSSDFYFVDYISSSGTFPIKYPTPSSTDDESESIFCIGLSPQGGWTTTDEFKTISHTIDGSQDIMFADIIKGTWDRKFETQRYRHLLTWIKISVCGTTVEAAKHWGKIKSLSISSANSVDIDFDQAGSSINYSGAQNIPVDLKYKAGETESTGIDFDITSRDAGEIFCSPATSFSITVVTEHGGTKTISIAKLTDENGGTISDIQKVRGKLFVISLYFSPFDIIEGTCTLNYWNDQSEDLYLKPENP
jgi:hypothetical protein